MLFVSAHFDEFPEDRDGGDEYYDEHDEGEVIGHKRDFFAEVVSGKECARRPGDAPENIVRKEYAVIHADDAGDDRRKGADDRNESRENDRLSAVCVIEFLGGVEV